MELKGRASMIQQARNAPLGESEEDCHTAARALMMLQMAVEEMESLPENQKTRLGDHHDLGEYVQDLSSRLGWLADGDEDLPVHSKGRSPSQPYIVAPRPGSGGADGQRASLVGHRSSMVAGHGTVGGRASILRQHGGASTRIAEDESPTRADDSVNQASSSVGRSSLVVAGSSAPGGNRGLLTEMKELDGGDHGAVAPSPARAGGAGSPEKARGGKGTSPRAGRGASPRPNAVAKVGFDFTSVDQLKSIFKEVDEDGNGQLDPSELQKVFEKCGRDFITEDVIKEFIGDFDNDGNGQLSFGEFVKVWNSTATHPVLMQAMRDGVQELARAPKKKVIGSSWMVLHPHAPVHADWELWITIMLVITLILLPLTLGFEKLACRLFYVNLTIDAMFMLDIFKQFNTGYADDNQSIILDRLRISIRYLKGYFSFDLVASFPYDVLSWGQQCKDGDQKYARAARLLKLVRLFRIMKLFRLLRFSKTFTLLRNTIMHYEDRYHVVIPESLIKMGQLLILLLLGAHWIGCIQFMIVAQAGFPRDSWVRFAKLENAPVARQYLWAYYKALAQMIVIGFEVPAAVNQSCETIQQWCAVEHWLTLVSLYFGAIFYSLLISNISMIVLSTNVGARTYRDKVQQVNEYMRSKSLPASLRDKVKDFYTVQYSEGKMFDEDKILRELSPSLRNEILAYNTRDLFSKVPLLFTAPEQFVKAIVPQLSLSVGLEGEKMIHENTTGDKMYFIYSGVCDITQGHGEKATTIETIADGCYFGDCAVILGCQRTANVATRTVSIVYSMSQAGLKDAIEHAPPDIIKYIRNVAKARRDRMQHYRRYGRDGLDTSGLILDDQEDTKTEMYRDCLRQKMEILSEQQAFEEEFGDDVASLITTLDVTPKPRFSVVARLTNRGGNRGAEEEQQRPMSPSGARERLQSMFGGRAAVPGAGSRVYADGGTAPGAGVSMRNRGTVVANRRSSQVQSDADARANRRGSANGGSIRRREGTITAGKFKPPGQKPPPHIARLRARQQAQKKNRNSVISRHDQSGEVPIFQRTLSQVVHKKEEDVVAPLLSQSRRRTDRRTTMQGAL